MFIDLPDDISDFLYHNWIHCGSGDFFTLSDDCDFAIHCFLKLVVMIEHSTDKTDILNKGRVFDFIEWSIVFSSVLSHIGGESCKICLV